MKRYFIAGLIAVLVSLLFEKTYAQTALSADEWSDFIDSTDAFSNAPGNCAIVFYPWARGAGVEQAVSATTFFDSRSFNSTDYAMAVDSGDYIYFTIKTDPYTSLIISQFSIKTSISKTVDTADIIIDYTDSPNTSSFLPVGEYIDTNHYDNILHSIFFSPAITIPANDTAIFRLVVATNFGNNLRTFKLFGGSVTATWDVDLNSLTAQINAPNTHYCYQDSVSIDIPVTLSGTPLATVYYTRDGIGDSVVINTTGTADIGFIETLPASGIYVYQLDSIRSNCYSKALNQTFPVTVYPPVPAVAVDLQ
jgi:hypothetical protein